MNKSKNRLLITRYGADRTRDYKRLSGHLINKRIRLSEAKQ